VEAIVAWGLARSGGLLLKRIIGRSSGLLRNDEIESDQQD
jgi:hypothetical protein